MIGTKFVRTVSVVDPDTNLPVEVEIRKMEPGGMFITVPDQDESEELDRLVFNGILSESFKAMIHRA